MLNLGVILDNRHLSPSLSPASIVFVLGLPEPYCNAARSSFHYYLLPALSIPQFATLCTLVPHNSNPFCPLKLLLEFFLLQQQQPASASPNKQHLPDNQVIIIREIILWNLEVQRRRTLPYTSADVVVRAVAGTEPAAEVAGLANGNASQVGADAQHDEPFGLLDAVFVFLGVAEFVDAVIERRWIY